MINKNQDAVFSNDEAQRLACLVENAFGSDAALQDQSISEALDLICQYIENS
jgi:hypothetical protein